jgi:hypothetical protein
LIEQLTPEDALIWMSDVKAVLLGILAWIVYPLWLLAGMADLWCHRRTSIATTAGAPESALHVAQVLLIGVAVIAAVFLEITTSVLIGMGILILAHSVLAFADIAYTNPRREISAFEQQVHAYMEVLPWTSLAFIAALNPQALIDATWAVQLKREPLPPRMIAAVLIPALVLAVIPTLLELIDTLKHRPRARAASRVTTASA